MKPHIAMVAVVVRDYDEAIAWYREAMGFELLEDEDRGGGKRWVRMAPEGNSGFSLLLAQATTPRQEMAIGDQHGGRVGFFLRVDDFDATYRRLMATGVEFVTEPRDEPYGRYAVFLDVAGNRWDLLGPRPV